jgi:hypothetical protein
MPRIADTHSSDEKLKALKKQVTSSYIYFRKNKDRFNEFMRFVFNTSLSNEDITKLQAVQKPTIEFNVIEAMINRLRGEFAMHEPGIVVRAADGVPMQKYTPQFLKMIEVIESYMRLIITDTANDGLTYKLYTDILGGGYSVAEVYTDYINELSFDQKIVVKRVYDPTMTGFDPLARESHKGDGEYCFQLYPRTTEHFIEEFGKEPLTHMSFSRSVGEFAWTYSSQNEQIVLVCEFFQKVKKDVEIVKLSTGHVVTEKHYDKLLKMWNEKGFIEQAPIVIEKRKSCLESIVRYRFCDTKVLSYDETDYKYLPLIFLDGNSVEMVDYENGSSSQMTRPYAYQARGIQRLRNFAGQTIGSEIENMVQHKFKVCIEAIPEDYQEAYRNVQQADVLMYNAFLNSDPNVPLPPPMEIQRSQVPAIVENIFMGSDKVTQAILGSYDGVLGINNQNISGVAISNGAIQSSAASTPYLMGFIGGLNRICQVVLDLIPKYYVTPRTLPIMKPDGKRGYQVVNDRNNPESVDIYYQPHELEIKVEAGVNSAVQKQVALDQIIKMMSASPLFAQFINTEGLETLLDNMDIRGIEDMKTRAAQFMEMMKKQQEEAAQQPDPMQEQLKQAIEVEASKVEAEKEKIELKHQEAEAQLAVKSAQVAIEKQKVDAQVLQILSEIGNSSVKLNMEREKIDSENARSAVEAAFRRTARR